MIRLYVAAAVVLCAAPAVHAATLFDNVVLASNPLAYWTLGDASGTTAVNLAGNPALNGTYHGGFTLGASGPVAGATGTAFNGSSGYVSLPGIWGGTAAGTIEAWINVAVNTGDFQAIVSPTNSSFFHYQVSTYGNDVVYVDDGGSADLAVVPPTPVGDWRYVVITAENGAEKWYENGVLISSASTSFDHITASALDDVRIASGFGGGRFFNGSIADVAIYDRALGSSEILQHYNAASVPEPGTFGLIGAAVLGLAAARRHFRR